MHRTQLLLNDEQNQRLREMAIQKGQSISEVVRQILEAYFAEQDRREQMEALEALKGLDQIREAGSQYGVYVGDPVNEIREERERHMEEVWQQRS